MPFRSTKFLWNLAVVLAARGFSQHFSAQPALRFPPSWVPPPFCCSGVSRTEKETEKVKRLCTGPCSFRLTPLRRFSSFLPPPLFFLSPGQDKYGLMKIGKSNLSFRPGKARGGEERGKGKREEKKEVGSATVGYFDNRKNCLSFKFCVCQFFVIKSPL